VQCLYLTKHTHAIIILFDGCVFFCYSPKAIPIAIGTNILYQTTVKAILLLLAGNLSAYGQFHSDSWGDFKTYFKFHIDSEGQIYQLEIGQTNY